MLILYVLNLQVQGTVMWLDTFYYPSLWSVNCDLKMFDWIFIGRPFGVPIQDQEIRQFLIIIKRDIPSKKEK